MFSKLTVMTSPPQGLKFSYLDIVLVRLPLFVSVDSPNSRNVSTMEISTHVPGKLRDGYSFSYFHSNEIILQISFLSVSFPSTTLAST